MDIIFQGVGPIVKTHLKYFYLLLDGEIMVMHT